MSDRNSTTNIRLPAQLRRLLGVATLVLLAAAGPASFAQPEPPRTNPARVVASTVLDRTEFAAELLRLATICDQLDLDAAAELSRRWLRPIRSDQTTLYLPGKVQPPEITSRDTKAKKWLEHFTAARQNYADGLYARAAQLAAQEDETAAFQLLWQILRENPEHTGGRRVLGNLVSPLRSMPRLRTAPRPENDLNWPAKSYTLATTMHFNVYSQADRPATAKFASSLEQNFAMWSQVFFPLWAPPGKLADAFANPTENNEFWKNRHKFDVVLLKDRAAYLKLLGASESNIGVSVGYYWPDGKKSFFYPSASLDATLTHELTHQFLAEGTRLDVKDDIGTDGGLWLLEGIAIYFESLTDHGNYWTLGGWDAPRMQTARYRGVRDGYWQTRKEFAAGNLEQWKDNPQISQLYTHAAGLTHTLMDGLIDAGDRHRTIQTLAGLYQGQNESLALLMLLGNETEAAQQRYQTGLTIHDSSVAELHASGHLAQELVLSGSQLSKESWAHLAHQTELTWLDLAYSNISTPQLLSWISGAPKLERLSVEGTKVDTSFLTQLGQLKELRELDLSYCQVDDAALEALRGNATIETLWLTQTQVTSACLETLRSMPKLKNCDAEGF